MECMGDVYKIQGAISELSLSKAVAAVNANLDTEVKKAIDDAAAAIWAIPSPFRNNINSPEAVSAMEACATLELSLIHI